MNSLRIWILISKIGNCDSISEKKISPDQIEFIEISAYQTLVDKYSACVDKHVDCVDKYVGVMADNQALKDEIARLNQLLIKK